MLWMPFSDDQCCLCGSKPPKLTGEHKIKASALRKQFDNAHLLIGGPGHNQRMKQAQSTNSKHLKFVASLCECCNSSRSQGPDCEFDLFHGLALARQTSNESSNTVFDLPQYRENSVEYLNVFRYLAKLLCCHIAAVGGPTPIAVAQFAIGASNQNRIWLELKRDDNYSKIIEHAGEMGYAAHGGLMVYADKGTLTPNSFYSTLTIGSLQYVFYTHLSASEQSDLLAKHESFCSWIKKHFLD